MTSQVSDMDRLRAMTEAAFLAEQANMTRITRREAHIRTQISELNDARKSKPVALEDDHAARAGADFEWQRWVDRRVSKLNAELARVLVAKARTHAKLTRAFGKHRVTGALLEQLQKENRTRRDKRDEQPF